MDFTTMVQRCKWYKKQSRL